MCLKEKKEDAMKNRMLIIISIFSVISGFSYVSEGHQEDPHYEWFEGDEVAALEDGIYADSNKGMFKLNVVEHDRVNNRYKVLCRCLEGSHLDPADALSVP